MTNRIENAKNLEDTIGQRTGNICWWTMHVKNNEPEHESLIEFAKEHGMEDFVTGKRSMKAALARAARYYFKGNLTALGEDGGEYSTKLAGRTANSLTIAILKSKSSAAGDELIHTVEPEVVDRVAYLKYENGSEMLVCDNDTREGHELIQQANKLCDLVTSCDIRMFLRNALYHGCMSIPLNGGGGTIWFVPDTYSEFLTSLAGFMSSIGRSSLSVAPQYGASNEAFSDAARNHFWEQLGDFHTDLKAISEKDRIGTYKNRLDKYREVKTRVDFYTELLGMKADDIKNDFAKLECEIKKSIGIIEIKKATKASEAKTKDAKAGEGAKAAATKVAAKVEKAKAEEPKAKVPIMTCDGKEMVGCPAEELAINMDIKKLTPAQKGAATRKANAEKRKDATRKAMQKPAKKAAKK